MKTAVAAPAEWQDIFDTIDAMTADELRAFVAILRAHLGLDE